MLPTSRGAPFPKGRTALLLIDMQRIWLEPGKDPDHPDWSADHPFHRTIREDVVPNQQQLLAAARLSGVEVIHTIIRSLTSDGRDRSLDHKLTPIHVAPDDPLGEPLAEVAPRNDEIVLPKTSSGVFNSTTLEYVLRNMDISHLVIAGIMTDQCVDMAVRDGADLGFAVTCVHDACAAADEERHSRALAAFGGYCCLATTDETVGHFRNLKVPND